MLVNIRVRAFGKTNTQTLESDPLDYPVYVCNGCLVANVLTCPFPSAPANEGNPCNVSQDNFVDCCSLNGELICPPDREHGAVRRGLVAALACVFGALGCTSASNTNPPLPPTGNGGIGPGIGGSGVPPPPSGDVFVEIQDPMDGLVAPAGSLVDVRVHAFVDQATGTDFIDTTSVEAVVTKAGDTAELESTKLAPQAPWTSSRDGSAWAIDRPATTR